MKLPTPFSYRCKSCKQRTTLYNLQTGHPVVAPDSLCDYCRLEGTSVRNLKAIAAEDGLHVEDFGCWSCNRVFTLLLGQESKATCFDNSEYVPCVTGAN